MRPSHPSHRPWKSPSAVIPHIPTARRLRRYTDISIGLDTLSFLKSSNIARNLQWILHQRPPPLGLPSPACMLPIHRASQYKTVSPCPQKSSPIQVAPINIAGRRRPFDPVPLQDLRLYCERLRPCAPHWYSGSRRGHLLELLPSHRGDRFLRSSLKPESGSRRLNEIGRASCRERV